ncbi:MAG: restriction endonuclease subunit S [Candidatus Syntropharchaeales archaeon]
MQETINALSYSGGSIKAKILLDKLKKDGLNLNNLDKFSNNIFVGARSKRLFTTKKEGIPYLMPIDLFMFNLKPRKWVRKETEDLESWWVSPFTILISQSGTPGRTLITNKSFDDKVVSPNVIRYTPNEEAKEKIGYIYAYLSSWIGQTFLTKDQYGSTVKHIEPHHVASIPIPRIPELEEEINQRIFEAHRLREEAQELLLKAEDMLYSELELPEIDEDAVEYFGGERGRIVKAFEIKASELNGRLDASYHEPTLKIIEKALLTSKFKVVKLEDISDEIIIPSRFKRPYVRMESNGVSFLQPSHVVEFKPIEIKLIWKGFSKINSFKVKKDQIVVTRSGTLGRAMLITGYFDGWIGSDDLARVTVDKEKTLPEYIMTFLLCDYGISQIARETYGGVIDHLEEFHIGRILLPLPPLRIQEQIGNLTREAYDKRDKANQIEDEAIKLLERRLEELAEGRIT